MRFVIPVMFPNVSLRILLFCALVSSLLIRLILVSRCTMCLVSLFVEVISLLRKILDSLVIHLLKWCFNWLYRQYDIFFDGVELWIQDKLPDISDIPELEGFEKE